jgi:hypothetical protein
MTVSKDEMDAHWSGPAHWLEMKDSADRLQAFREAIKETRSLERERCAQLMERMAAGAHPEDTDEIAEVLKDAAQRIRGLPDREDK